MYHPQWGYLRGYGVATVSRIDSITGLFCRMLSFLQGSFAKKTYNLIDPTIQSHPHTSEISCIVHVRHDLLYCSCET